MRTNVYELYYIIINHNRICDPIEKYIRIVIEGLSDTTSVHYTLCYI